MDGIRRKIEFSKSKAIKSNIGKKLEKKDYSELEGYLEFKDGKRQILQTEVSINQSEFMDNTNLVKVKLPKSVKVIGQAAFRGCINLKEIEMSDSITEIKPWTFFECSSLEKIKLSQNIKIIGHSAFKGCVSLEEMNLPQTVKVVEYSAFKNCKNLKEISIPGLTREISSRTFEGCVNLEKITLGILPYIGPHALDNCFKLGRLVISEGTKNIKGLYFSEIKKIEIPDSVTFIEENVFGTYSKSEICIYCNEKSYAEQYAQKNHIEYKYLNGVKKQKISQEQKPKQNKKTNIQPKSKKQEVEIYRGDKSYERDNSITKVSIDNFVSTVNKNAFRWCDNLEEVVIMGNSVERICDYAFSNCKNLKKIIIPNSVTKIGDNAFLWSENLCIYCNKESYAEQFAQRRAIKYEYINNYLGFGGYFYDGTSLKGNKSVEKVLISYHITKISFGAFAECINLREVNIPNNIKSIASYAFDKCINLKKIEIPNSVSYIENLAFNGCINLKEIEIPNSVSIIGHEAFNGCSDLCIYCNKGSYAEQYAQNNNIKYKYLNGVKKVDSSIINTSKESNNYNYVDKLSNLKKQSNDYKEIIEELENEESYYIIYQLIMTLDIIKNEKEKNKKLEEENKKLGEENEKLEEKNKKLEEELKLLKQKIKSGNRNKFSSSKIKIIKNMKEKGINIRLIAMEFNCSIEDIKNIIDE